MFIFLVCKVNPLKFDDTWGNIKKDTNFSKASNETDLKLLKWIINQ